MSEDKTKPDEQAQEQAEDESPEVEAHRFKARTIEPGEDAADESDRFKARRPTGL